MVKVLAASRRRTSLRSASASDPSPSPRPAAANRFGRLRESGPLPPGRGAARWSRWRASCGSPYLGSLPYFSLCSCRAPLRSGCHPTTSEDHEREADRQARRRRRHSIRYGQFPGPGKHNHEKLTTPKNGLSVSKAGRDPVSGLYSETRSAGRRCPRATSRTGRVRREVQQDSRHSEL